MILIALFRMCHLRGFGFDELLGILRDFSQGS